MVKRFGSDSCGSSWPGCGSSLVSGSSSCVAGEMFKRSSNTDILHVDYKSNLLAVSDLLGGQIDRMITDTTTGLPQIKGRQAACARRLDRQTNRAAA